MRTQKYLDIFFMLLTKILLKELRFRCKLKLGQEMAQLLDCFPSMQEALGWIPSTT